MKCLRVSWLESRVISVLDEPAKGGGTSLTGERRIAGGEGFFARECIAGALRAKAGITVNYVAH
jgi:hypothetical protein